MRQWPRVYTGQSHLSYIHVVQWDRTDSGIWGSSGGTVDSHGQSHLSHGTVGSHGQSHLSHVTVG